MTTSNPDSAAAFTLKERFQIGASLIPPIALLWLGTRIGWGPIPPLYALTAMPCALAIGMALPGAFAGWHRVFCRGQSWIGHRLLAGLLALAFILALVPVGLWLRFRGTSFLSPPSGDSFWVPARPPGSLRDQY